MADVSTKTVDGVDYTIIRITRKEFEDSHLDHTKAINTHSNTKKNNVLLVDGKDPQTDISNKEKRKAIFRELGF